MKTRLLVLVAVLGVMSVPAFGDKVEVTFTGTIIWLFQPVDPVVAGVTVGDPFTAVLTFNPHQADADPSLTIGEFFD